MKSIAQVSLAILLVAVLVYLMYWQSQDKQEAEFSGGDQVVSNEPLSEDQEDAKTEPAEGMSLSAEDESALDEVLSASEEEPTPQAKLAPSSPSQARAPQSNAAKNKPKATPQSLRESRRKMFHKIDEGVKDGMLSKEEHDVYFRKAFNFYDKNKDGRLTGKEQNQIKRLPPRADKNKDGILTRKEFLDQFDHFFVTMDKDESGDLTEKEFVR